MNKKLKIVNYIGDYGPVNFWQSITREEVDRDLSFIKKENFNAIILMIPYSTFKPSFDSFENEYNDLLRYIIETAKEIGISTILRIGYLWESDFMQDRTYERYTDIFKNYTNNSKSLYEDDFVKYINYYHDNFDILNMFISWEDFFWPVKHQLSELSGDELDIIVRDFIEYLLGKVGVKKKLFIEQRTNGTFNPIRYNSELSYGYYNTFCLSKTWYDLIKNDYVHNNMVVEKQFLEWYGRVSELLNINEDNTFVIDQFNIIDNTFEDDPYHMFPEDSTLRNAVVTLENYDGIMSFLGSVLPNLLGGIGVWSLWTCVAGQVYNGTFKFGLSGWKTDGMLSDSKKKLILGSGQSISSDFAYARVGKDFPSNHLLLNYSCDSGCQLVIDFGGKTERLKLEPGVKHESVMDFKEINDKKLKITCESGEVNLHRIDYFSAYLKSFMFSSDRTPLPTYSAMADLIKRFDSIDASADSAVLESIYSDIIEKQDEIVGDSGNLMEGDENEIDGKYN